MNLGMANDASRCGLASTSVHNESHEQAGEVEAPVELNREPMEPMSRAACLPVDDGLVSARIRSSRGRPAWF